MVKTISDVCVQLLLQNDSIRQKEELRSILVGSNFLNSGDLNKNATALSSGNKRKRLYVYNVETFLVTLQSVTLNGPLRFLCPSVNWEVCLQKASKSAAVADCSSPNLNKGKRRNNVLYFQIMTPEGAAAIYLVADRSYSGAWTESPFSRITKEKENSESA